MINCIRFLIFITVCAFYTQVLIANDNPRIYPEQCFEPGCGIYRELVTDLSNVWHAALFGYFTYDKNSDEAKFIFYENDGSGWSDAIRKRVVTLENYSSANRINDLKSDMLAKFRLDSDDLSYNGSYYNKNRNASKSTDIIATSHNMLDESIWWCGSDMIETGYWDLIWETWKARISDIEQARCDAQIEYPHEKNDCYVARGGYYIGHSGWTNLSEHNDACLNTGWYEDGETCPIQQAGELGNDSSFEEILDVTDPLGINPGYPIISNINCNPVNNNNNVQFSFIISDDFSEMVYETLQIYSNPVNLDFNANFITQMQNRDLDDYDDVSNMNIGYGYNLWDGLTILNNQLTPNNNNLGLRVSVVDQGGNLIYVDFPLGAPNTIIDEPLNINTDYRAFEKNIKLKYVNPTSDIFFPVHYTLESNAEWIHLERNSNLTTPNDSSFDFKIILDKNYDNLFIKPHRTGEVTATVKYPDREEIFRFNITQDAEPTPMNILPTISVVDDISRIFYLDPDTNYPYLEANITNPEHELKNIASGDYDGDGLDEIAVTTRSVVLLFEKNQTTPYKTISFNFLLKDIASGDINGDGIDEIFVCNTYKIIAYDTINNEYLIDWNINDSGYNVRITTAHCDYDNKLEIVVAKSDGLTLYNMVSKSEFLIYANHEFNRGVDPECGENFDITTYQGDHMDPRESVAVLCEQPNETSVTSSLKGFTYVNTNIQEKLFFEKPIAFDYNSGYRNYKLTAGNFLGIYLLDVEADQFAILSKYDTIDKYSIIDCYIIESPNCTQTDDSIVLEGYASSINDISCGDFHISDRLDITGEIIRSDIYRAGKIINTNAETSIENNTTIKLISGENIIFNPGFKAKKGCKLNTLIESFSK